MPSILRQFRGLTLVAVLLLIIAGSWWVATSGPDAVENEAGRDRPDAAVSGQPVVPVVIYLVDTLRADRLGLYGYNKTTSWRLDNLANESVVFDQAYAAAPWTLPSVASLITSTFPCEHRLLDAKTALSLSIKTLAERMSSISYFTGATFNNAFAGPLVGLERGYDIIAEHVVGITKKGHAAQVTTFLERAGNRPFLLYVHTMELHDTYLTPYRFIHRFGEINPELMEEYPTFMHEYNRFRHADWKIGNPLGMTDNTIEQEEFFAYFNKFREPIELLYDAATLWADANVGEVIDILKKRGVWDKAIFIFLSDHGEEIGEHGGWFHGQSVYEELAHVPLLIHFPGGEFGGRRISNPVSLVDIMPTIFDYLGHPALCSDCRGQSLMPLISGTDESNEPHVTIPTVRINRINYFKPWKESRGDVNVMLRQDHWKGIWNDDLKSLELYDLDTDPVEQVDVSKKHAELAVSLGESASQWLETCLSLAPPPEEMQEIDETTMEKLRAMGYFN